MCTEHHGQRTDKTIVAVCGKGGVGKTVLATLLARALREEGIRPLLLIDADPVGGLASALGEKAVKTLGAVRAEVIGAARHGDEEARRRVAEQLDYMVFEALTERKDYALLCMGRSLEQGCFCPVNTLLRQAIDLVVGAFAITIIDAEAGVEQINRQVTRHVSHVVVVTDGSARSRETLRLITDLVGRDRVHVVANRADASESVMQPEMAGVCGSIPEDDTVRGFDRDGIPLWGLPSDNPALLAARQVVRRLGLPALSAGG